jgi:hypothetical protein
VGLRAGLEAVETRRISSPCQELNPGHPSRTPSLKSEKEKTMRRGKLERCKVYTAEF